MELKIEQNMKKDGEVEANENDDQNMIYTINFR